MKILIVMDVYQSNGNGTSISALRFTEVLRKHGYKMQILPISNGIDPSFCYRKDRRDEKFEGKIVIVMTGRYASGSIYDKNINKRVTKK